MSRDIKFRAWDKKYLKMVGQKGAQDLFSLRSDGVPSNEYYELMQYTGLNDKKGVEIYEGDILKPKNGKPRKVIYHGGSFKHTSHSKRGGKEPLFPQLIHIRQFEVIGNIYENLELLGVK